MIRKNFHLMNAIQRFNKFSKIYPLSKQDRSDGLPPSKTKVGIPLLVKIGEWFESANVTLKKSCKYKAFRCVC